MDADDENIEPVTDLGLSLGYLNQCIRRKLNGDSGAGANAGSRIHRAFVAPEPLSELVWDTDKGPSNVTLSPPQSNIGRRSATDRLTDVDFLTAQTTVHLTREVASKEMTMSPTSDAGVMPICRSSHETGNGSNVEEVKVAVEVSVPHNQEGHCSQANVEVHEIPQVSETRENFITRLSGSGDREGADILFVESDQKIPFVEQTEPLLEDSVGQDRRADVGDQKMQLVLTSEVHPVNESKASDAPAMNKEVQGSRPLDILEATAENDLMNLKDEHAHAAESQFLGSESSPGVKDRYEQGQEMLPGNESVLDKHTNTSIHMCRRKGKEKALSDGDMNGRMTKDKDDSHESVESCNSAGLFSSGKKRWNSEEEFIVGSKRFRKQILETPICASSIRQDSSFMVWISSMVKGFSKSMQDEVPPLALTLAHPDHGDENPDNKLITCNLNQGDAVKSIGFQTIFQSLYCPTAERQEAQILSNNHKIGDISTELEPATSPKVCHGENINLGRGFMLPVEKFNKSSSGNEVRSAGSQGKGHTGSEEKKNPCNFPFYKRKDRVGPNSSLGKHKKRRVENVESSSQFKGKTTDEFGYRRDLMGSLWITRFTPKTPGPSLIADHYNKSADGVLECSNDHKHVGDKEQSAGDLVIVIGNNLQNCAADNEGSSAFNRNKGQNGQASMSEFSPILPSYEVRSSEVASVFARRLDALKNITPSSVSDYYCSQSETKLNSRIDGDMKLLTGKESQFEASVAHTCFNEDTSRMETGINMSWNANETRASKKISYRSNSVMKNSASSSVENKLKENQIMPSSQFVNTQIPNIPKGIIDSVKRLRLSRTDVRKWMDSCMSLSQLEGFFLRLRLGKWEEGLGGSGYCVSCITGSQKESCPQNVKDSIAVIVGGIRCMVKSKHVSNNDFHEDELKAWWSATSKSSGKIPCEEDLREKVKRKRMLGL